MRSISGIGVLTAMDSYSWEHVTIMRIRSLAALIVIVIMATNVAAANDDRPFRSAPPGSTSRRNHRSAWADCWPGRPRREKCARTYGPKHSRLGSDRVGPSGLFSSTTWAFPMRSSKRWPRLKRTPGLARERLAVGSSHAQCSLFDGRRPNIFGKPIPADQQERIDR